MGVGGTEYLTTMQEDRKEGNFDLIVRLGLLVLSYLVTSASYFFLKLFVLSF